MEIKRDQYLQKLIARRGNGLIKIVTGMRRCGKSYLLFRLFRRYLIESGVAENHIIEIQLDNITNSEFLEPRRLYDYIVSRMVDKGMYFILLDEIQMVSNFETVLNSLLHLENADVYVTGSNSRFLSTDIITEFRGRGDEVRVYPLSFAEFMSVYPGDKYQGWYDYALYGGLPQILTYQTEEQKREYLRSVFLTTYLRDIADRHKIRKRHLLEELCQVLASTMSSLTNPANLAKAFNNQGKDAITRNTILSYISYMEDAFLIHQAKRYDVKGKRYINSQSKYYFADPGIRNAILDFRQIDAGHLMEQVLYIELLRQGYRVDVGSVEKRLILPDGTTQRKVFEVDFVAENASNCIYVQSSYDMPTPEKIAQERTSLSLIQNAFQKVIVTHEPIRQTTEDDGISIISLYDFLKI